MVVFINSYEYKLNTIKVNGIPTITVSIGRDSSEEKFNLLELHGFRLIESFEVNRSNPHIHLTRAIKEEYKEFHKNPLINGADSPYDYLSMFMDYYRQKLRNEKLNLLV